MSTAFRHDPPSLRRVGTLREIYCRPLFHALTHSASSEGIPSGKAELLLDTASSHIERLLSKELEAAFISPMDYALNSSDLIIVPGIGVSSSGMSGVARLYFRENLTLISTIAVGVVSTIDVVLSRLVLAEKYDAAPPLIPVLGTVDEMLAKADCALLSGDQLFSLSTDKPFIDLVDEWNDFSELPFVHTLCVMRNESYNIELAELLSDSQQRGRLSLESISNELSKEAHQSPEIIKTFLSHFSYGFDEEERHSLEEFLRMAYYHGMLGDIPEITIGG